MPNNNFLINLSVLYRNTQKYFDKALAPYDIGSGQVQFLFFINENEGITMQEMSKIIEIDKGTASKSIQRLMDQGFVHTKTDEHDRRIKRLYTTKKATEIMPMLYEYRNELRAQIGSDTDIHAFEQLLDRLVANSRLSSIEHKDRYGGLRIGGLHKMSLSDYEGKASAVIFTSGCCFKCPYCHNKDLVFIPENYQFLDPKEIISFLQKRIGVLDGVVISGGEPLMQEGLLPFLKDIKALGYLVKIETCGNYPDQLATLIQEGLVDFVSLDYKNTAQKYPMTVGMNEENVNLNAIRKSLKILKESNVEYEVVTTIVKELHSQSDINALAKKFIDVPWVIQSFVPSEHVIQSDLTAYSKQEMNEIWQTALKIHPQVKLRG